MAKSILDLIISSKKQGTGVQDTKQGLDGLKTGLTQAGLAIGAVAAAAYAANRAFDATVGAVIDYNKSILDASRATGTTTEDFSRIVQVADDFGVSMSEVETALALATKNGFAPSVNSIASLADQLNAIDDPTKRAADAAKIFGRNWAALDPILQQGGAAIREASAATADGLVVTEEEAQRTEELRMALDTTNDAYIALKNNIGLTAIEHTGLTHALERANLMLSGEITFIDGWADALGIKLIPQLVDVSAETGSWEERQRGVAAALRDTTGAAGEAVTSYQDLSEQQLITAATEAFMAGDKGLAAHLLGLAREAHKTESAYEALRRAIQAAARAATGLHEQGIGGIGGFQHGGSFVVPGTGSGDRPFVLGLEPGERVTVTPRSQVFNNQRSLSINQMNIRSGNPAGVRDELIQFFEGR